MTPVSAVLLLFGPPWIYIGLREGSLVSLGFGILLVLAVLVVELTARLRTRKEVSK